MVRLIVHVDSFYNLDDVIDKLEALGVRVVRRGRVAPYVVVEAPDNLVKVIKSLKHVVKVEVSGVFRVMQVDDDLRIKGRNFCLMDVINEINALYLYDLGIKGQGLKVAVIDSGVCEENPCLRGKVIKEIDYVEGDERKHPHGTWVMGAVLGSYYCFNSYEVQGVAPCAMGYSLRVLNSRGEGYRDWIISALEDCLDLDVDVINLSLGARTLMFFSLEQLIISKLLEQGKVVVCSAGNFGPRLFTLAFPGYLPNVVTVGSCSLVTKEASWFSSRGPSPYLFVIKPDLVTYGGAGDLRGERQEVERILGPWGEGFGFARGTSMSAPVVSGALLLVKQVLGYIPSPYSYEFSYVLSEVYPHDFVLGRGYLDLSGLEKLLRK